MLLLVGCGSSVQSKTEYQKITVEQAAELMSKGESVTLDVRTKEEYDAGHIKGAILLPYDEIKKDASITPLPDKNQTVLVYCRTGMRSEIAARELISMGYTNVFDFGGIVDWPGEIVLD